MWGERRGGRSRELCTCCWTLELAAVLGVSGHCSDDVGAVILRFLRKPVPGSTGPFPLNALLSRLAAPTASWDFSPPSSGLRFASLPCVCSWSPNPRLCSFSPSFFYWSTSSWHSGQECLRDRCVDLNCLWAQCSRCVDRPGGSVPVCGCDHCHHGTQGLTVNWGKAT